MQAKLNILKVLLPYILLSVAAMFGAFVAIETVWEIWTGSVAELPDGTGYAALLLVPLLVGMCLLAILERTASDQGNTRKILITLGLLIAGGIYLQSHILGGLEEARLEKDRLEHAAQLEHQHQHQQLQHQKDGR